MKLSIIIPVYNVEKLLEKCLKSVIKIPLKEIEIILINDGSTDNSKQICEKYLHKDKRIKLLNQDNFGQAYARNRGVELAKGKYITFIDSDDWIDCKGLMELLKNIEEYQLDIIYGEYTIVQGENRENILKQHTQEICTGIELLDRNLDRDCVPVEVVTNIYKKTFLENNNIRFVEGLLHEDALFSLTCYLYAKRVKSLPINYYYYYIREGSTMRTIAFKNYVCQLYISDKLQTMKEKNEISSVAWDTIIFSLYFDSVKNGNIKDTNLYSRIKRNHLTIRSKIKKILIPLIHKNAEQIDFKKVISEYLIKE